MGLTSDVTSRADELARICAISAGTSVASRVDGSFYPQPDLMLLPHNLAGVNFKEVNEDNKQKLFGEIYTAIDTLAFTFGNV